MVADCLAKGSIDNEVGLCRLSTMPEFAADAVIDDMVGLVRPCVLSAAFVAD
jgi:hypothetical protein